VTVDCFLLQVYSYTAGTPPSLVPNVQLLSSKKVSPGLSSLVGANPDQVALYLTGCLDNAKSLVPQKSQASTPVYIMATAGTCMWFFFFFFFFWKCVIW
jgi:Golgi nucleoside diphosphatase